MSFIDPIVGGTVERIPAQQSPNFLTGVSGWIIRQDGSAEFNNLTIRGTFNGTDFIIDSAGIFFYSGTPASGNLLISIANTAGNDTYGNAYPQGMSISSSGKSVVLGETGGAPLIYFISGAPDLTNGAALQDIVLGAGLGQYDFLQILSAENTTNNDLVLQSFGGSSQDGSQPAEITQQYKDSLGVFHTFYTMTKNGPVFPAGLAVDGALAVNAVETITGATASGLLKITNTTVTTTPDIFLTEASTAAQTFGSEVAGDAHPRVVMNVKGDLMLGGGAAATDVTVLRSSPGVYAVGTGSFAVTTAGQGLRVKEGSNAKQGTATLTAGSAVVANTSVTASSRIFLTSQADGGTPGFLRVSARTAGTSFTVTSSSATDTSTVAYQIFEPG